LQRRFMRRTAPAARGERVDLVGLVGWVAGGRGGGRAATATATAVWLFADAHDSPLHKINTKPKTRDATTTTITPTQLHRRVPHRQCQSHRVRRQGGDDQGRRQAGRAGQRRVQLYAARAGAHSLAVGCWVWVWVWVCLGGGGGYDAAHTTH
jgi:hypothetical protein